MTGLGLGLGLVLGLLGLELGFGLGLAHQKATVEPVALPEVKISSK